MNWSGKYNCCLGIILLFAGVLPVSAQLNVSSVLTPQQWVQNVLIGQGVVVSNVTYTGAQGAGGTFIGNTNVGLNSGVILTSGAITVAPGPNNQGAAGSANTGGGDPDLAMVAAGTIYNACVLEFDFIPESDTVKFNYVFGSDEYHEWVGSSFNDVFGFFISGPGITGPFSNNSRNIALIPNTFTPVSINNVNNGGANTGPCNNCAYLIDNTGGTTIQYDAFTVVLTAISAVIPCQTYHIKLAISDVGDQAYDSGVFLEENSFTSTSIGVNLSYQSSANPGLTTPNAIEGCRKAILRFTLPFARTDTSTIQISSIGGTAVNGVDYTYIPNSVTILPFHVNGELVIDPIYDGIAEGTEYIEIGIRKTICDTIDTILVIPILDYEYINATSNNDTSLCEGQKQLFVNATGGMPPYFIQWSPTQSLNSSTIPNPVSSLTQTTTYIVQVKDSTRCSVGIDSTRVEWHPKPMISFKPDPYNGCDSLTVSFSNITAPDIQSYLWDFGDGTTSTLEDPIHTFHYDPNTPKYTITLHAITNAGCDAVYTVPGLIEVFENPVAAFKSVPDSAAITEEENPTIQFNNNSSLNAISYLWYFGDSLNSTSTDPSPSFTYTKEGLYIVWLFVTTENGCRDSISDTLKIVLEIDYDLTVPNIITPNGDGKNDKFVVINLEKYPMTQLLVFNRWGKKVTEISPYLNDWDGDGLADGTYYFIIRYKKRRSFEQIDGTLTILR